MKTNKIHIEFLDTIAIITLRGKIKADEIIDTLGVLFKNPDYVSGCSIWDFSRALGESSYNEIRKIAQFASHNRGERPRGRVAIIVKSILHFGLSRIYQSLTDNSPFDLEIFRSFDKALTWIKTAQSKALQPQ
jgi:hypothetical protein